MGSKETDMKIFAKLLASLVVNTHAAATCPDGIYKVECQCDKFFMCTHGKPIPEQNCAPGTLFNPAIGLCDWSRNVDCSPCSEQATNVQEKAENEPSYWQCLSACADVLPLRQQWKCPKRCWSGSLYCKCPTQCLYCLTEQFALSDLISSL